MFLKSGFSVLTIKNHDYPATLKNLVMESIGPLIKIENAGEGLFHPGYYVLLLKTNPYRTADMQAQTDRA